MRDGFFILFVALAFWLLWRLINRLSQGMALGDTSGIDRSAAVGASLKEVRLARYEHVRCEVARYRDLIWKIAAYAWAMYYGISLIHKAEGLPSPFYAVALLLTAVAVSVFYVHCEVMIEQNRRRIIALEEVLRLDMPFRHRDTNAHPLALIGSFIVFGVAIWMPFRVLVSLR